MKIKHDNKKWHLKSTSRGVNLWRWQRSFVEFIWAGVALTILTFWLTFTVNPNWAFTFIGIVPVYIAVVGANSDTEFADCKEEFHLAYPWRDAAADFLTITEGPYVKLAEDSLRSMIAESFDEGVDRSGSEWAEAAERLATRARKERRDRKKPSQVTHLHDFLDALDEVERDAELVTPISRVGRMRV